MADMRGAAREIDRQQWVRDNKARSLELCSMALETANELFDRGDLSPYLTILSRLHWYNFYNLLLILRQYPQATHLSSFKEWQGRMSDPQQQVLKREYIGKGIELVAPFTNLQPHGTRSLSWYCVKQFDISQTNVKGYEPPKSIYLAGEKHTRELIRSLTGILRGEYGKIVFYDQASEPYRSGNAGYTEGDKIHCRPGLSESEQLLWLSENVISLSSPDRVTGERYRRMFLQMAQHCLLRMWGIEDRQLLYLSQDKDLIRSVSADLRPVFLDLLQRRVRHIEESVHCKYQEHLREREEEDEFEFSPSFQAIEQGAKEKF